MKLIPKKIKEICNEITPQSSLENNDEWIIATYD